MELKLFENDLENMVAKYLEDKNYRIIGVPRFVDSNLNYVTVEVDFENSVEGD